VEHSKIWREAKPLLLYSPIYPLFLWINYSRDQRKINVQKLKELKVYHKLA